MSAYSPDLLFASAFALVAGWIILYGRLPQSILIPILVIRVLIPLVYFGWFYDASWNFIDDLTYYERSADLRARGFSCLDLLFSRDGHGLISSLSGSRHILYYAWNVLAQSLLGDHYYSTVFLNVVVSFVTCALFSSLLQHLGFNPVFRQWMLIFHVLHWEYCSWTSLINAKENLSEVLIVGAVYAFCRFQKSREYWLLAMIGICFSLLSILRFYVPFLLLTAFAIVLLLQAQNAKHLILGILLMPVLIAFLPFARQFQSHVNFSDLITGGLRVILTPQPWRISREYGFLLVPSLLQWAFAAPAIFGTLLMLRKTGPSRTPAVVLLCFILFYASFELDVSPRMRVQLTHIFAFTEAYFLWSVYHAISPNAIRQIQQPPSRAANNGGGQGVILDVA